MTENEKYTLHLILMECLEAQESDGDEPYLLLNKERIWSWDLAGSKMHDNLNKKDASNAFDFRTCKFRTLQGWTDVENYEAGQFSLAGLTGSTSLQLWESDEGEILRGDDDFLGELVVTAESVRMGEQAIEFNQNNALYEFTFRVTLDAE